MEQIEDTFFENCDRISSLHDSILHHILSFLPTKCIAQTRILSRRWNKLCVSLPFLNLEESRATQKTNFIDFVTRLFLSRDMSIKISQFRLSCKHACDNSHVNAWITYAVRAGVEELDFCTEDFAINTRCLPSCLFDCNSLVELKLNFHILPGVRFPKFFCFPKMKRMHLSRVILPDNFMNLICKSTNLEFLLLKFCQIDTSSKSLHTKSLHALQHLIADDHTLGNFSCLIDANIDVLFYYHIGRTGRFLSKFMRRLCSVKALTLSRMSIIVLSCRSRLLDHFPTFCNLTYLQLTMWSTVNEIRTMAELLRCFPVLHTLVIRFLKLGWAEERDLTPEEFPSLPTATTLKSIKMDHFLANNNQCQLVRLFLANARCLDKFTIQVDKYAWKDTFEVVDHVSLYKQLLQFPRLSSSCVLQVIECN